MSLKNKIAKKKTLLFSDSGKSQKHLSPYFQKHSTPRVTSTSGTVY